MDARRSRHDVPERTDYEAGHWRSREARTPAPRASVVVHLGNGGCISRRGEIVHSRLMGVSLFAVEKYLAYLWGGWWGLEHRIGVLGRRFS